MTANLRAFPYVPYTFPHLTPVRPSVASGKAQDEPSRATPERNISQPRRMVAVTVALSEPFDATPELDWAATVASVLRLTYANTTVEVIDSWRVDA